MVGGAEPDLVGESGLRALFLSACRGALPGQLNSQRSILCRKSWALLPTKTPEWGWGFSKHRKGLQRLGNQ